MTEGYNGSDLRNFVSEAAMKPVEDVEKTNAFVLVNGKYAPANPFDEN